MNPEQEIRAAAANAAASLLCVAPPPFADFVDMAEAIEMYIRNGKAAALSLLSPQPVQEQSAPAPVVQDAAPPVPEPALTPAMAPEPEVQQRAEVIPLAARVAVPPKQEGARRIIEKHRKERVDSLIGQATVAKVRAHKQRLYDEAEESGLLDYGVAIDGKSTTVGAYLSSLLGS